MTTAFGGGDLAGGIVDAIRQMADAAGRRPPLTPVEHARSSGSTSQHDTPALGAGSH